MYILMHRWIELVILYMKVLNYLCRKIISLGNILIKILWNSSRISTSNFMNVDVLLIRMITRQHSLPFTFQDRKRIFSAVYFNTLI